MTTQETVRVSADLTFTTDRGEVPDKPGLERLIADQMSGELDDTTGLGCMAVTITGISGDLAGTEHLVLTLTPVALREAYADDAANDLTAGMTDEQLAKVGEAILADIYDEYRRLLDLHLRDEQ